MRVLIISLSDLATDPRVNRQIRLLATKYQVVAAGFADPSVDGVEYVPITQLRKPLMLKMVGALLLKTRQYDRHYWMDRRVQCGLGVLEGQRFDAIIANDLLTLPLALRVANGAKVIFDAHEYSPREYEDSFFWRFFFQGYYHHLCGKYMASADAMFTVCQSIADEYRAQYHVNASVVMNAPPYQDLQPTSSDSNIIRMVHHGGAGPSRKLELMIEAVELLDNRFSLDMLLVPSVPGYLSRLKSLVADRPRVRILPPVPMRELPASLNRYDIGLYLLPPNSFNNYYALPNKFFEFVQARLAVAVGPSVEMARLVRQYDCGIVSGDFTPQSLAARLRELTRERIDYFKERSHLAARELCFERNAEIMLKTVEELMGSD